MKYKNNIYSVVFFIFLSSPVFASTFCNDPIITYSPLIVDGKELDIGITTSTTTGSYNDCPKISVFPDSPNDNKATIIRLVWGASSGCNFWDGPTVSLIDKKIIFTHTYNPPGQQVLCTAAGRYDFYYTAFNLPIGKYSIDHIYDRSAQNQSNFIYTSQFVVCPSSDKAYVSSNLDMYIPALEFNNQITSGEFTFQGQDSNGDLFWKLKQHGYHSDCGLETVGTVNQDLDIKIDSIEFQTPSNPQNIWVDLEFSHKENNELFWRLKDYGVNN